MWLLIVLEALLVFLLTLLIYRKYASWSLPWYVPVTVLLGWYFSFSIVFLAPIDVASSWYDVCRGECQRPATYMDEESLLVFWRIIYWTMYVFCWTAYPVLQSYSLAGGFSVLDRLRAAIIENVVIYGVSGAVMLILLIWIAAKSGLTGPSLMGIAIAFANGWGLLLVILLMGYGLVEIPRNIWRNSNRRTMIKYYQFQAVTLYDDLQTSEDRLEKTLKLVKKLEESVSEHDPWRAYIVQIIEQALPEYEDIEYGEGNKEITLKNLVKLSQRVARVKHDFRKNKCLYENLIDGALALQDVIEEETNPSTDYVIHWSHSKPRVGKLGPVLDKLEWLWKIWLETTALRILGLISVLLSVTLLWSEVTFSSKDEESDTGIDLSLWSLLIHAEGLSDLSRQFFVFVAITYLSICVYWSLFHFRFFDLYRLLPHQQTDPSSLLFAALYLGRLTAPLVYNFLIMIHTGRTAFVTFMGDMAEVPFLGTSFNTYLPLALGIIVLATAFNLYSRMAQWLQLRRFHFDKSWSDAQVDEGADLLKRERLARDRKISGDSNRVKFGKKSAVNIRNSLSNDRLLEQGLAGPSVGRASPGASPQQSPSGGGRFPKLSNIFGSRNVDKPINGDLDL